MAREARGLVVVAEQHRDEFRAVAQYLNDLAEHSPERGIAVWLVEAKAVRIEESKWAPLFTAVVQPNRFTATVEQAKQLETTVKTLDEFLAQVGHDSLRNALTVSRPSGQRQVIDAGSAQTTWSLWQRVLR